MIVEQGGRYYLVDEGGSRVVQEFVRKHSDQEKWAVFSKQGKKLSKWYTSRKDALSRLGQIEMFKHM